MKRMLKIRSVLPITNERGAETVEVALWLALVTIVSIVTVTALGGNVNTLYGVVRDAIAAAMPAPA